MNNTDILCLLFGTILLLWRASFGNYLLYSFQLASLVIIILSYFILHCKNNKSQLSAIKNIKKYIKIIVFTLTKTPIWHLFQRGFHIHADTHIGSDYETTTNIWFTSLYDFRIRQCFREEHHKCCTTIKINIYIYKLLGNSIIFPINELSFDSTKATF